MPVTGKSTGARRPPEDGRGRVRKPAKPRVAALPPEEARARILQAIAAIPTGQVAGYGEVAARAGLPGRARLVARVLAGQGDPALPWHRVLRSDGRIALPEGSRGWREQRQRLRAEGWVVEGGRVKRAKPAQVLDQVLWGPG